MNRASMPLSCTICSSQPSFSDVSHLLTHISSKQHLSNYFKIQVQSNGDDEAQALLDRFDAWYERWNMGELLKERMDQKAKKKGNASTARRSSSTRIVSKAVSKLKPGSQVKEQPPESSIKLEHQYSRTFTPIVQQAYASVLSNRPSFPSYPQWPASPMIKVEHEASSNVDADVEQELTIPSYPLRPQRFSYHYRMSDDTNDLSSDYNEVKEEDEEPDVSIKEGIKLKGVFWPGMNLFDSATPEMQRKRNQKKTTDVVIQLEATSKNVDPEENIYDMSGSFLKSREITGNPEIPDTPLRGETTPEASSPPPQKRKPRKVRKPRTALTNQDVNSRIASHRIRRSHTSFGNKRTAVYLDESDVGDDAITYQGTRKKRGGLSIHRDNSGPDITLDGPSAQRAYGGLQLNMMGSDYAYTSLSGRHGNHNHHAGPYTFGYDRPATLPNMGEFSTFGQLTHGFRPSYNAFAGLDAMRRDHGPHDFGGPASLSTTMLGITGHGDGIHAAQTYPMHMLPSFYPQSNHTGLGMFDSVHAHLDSAANPIFYGDEQMLPDDQSVKNERVKLEDDDDDETISLPSAQK